MTAHREEGPGEAGPPIPRDLPDQQSRSDEDPWDVTTPDLPDAELPDTDEAGTGRRGTPGPAGAPPGQPVPDDGQPIPDEPSD